MSTSGAERIGKSVRRFYSRYGIREWQRLVEDPYHQIEFITTMYFLKKYLPRRGHILDAGGGPGRYTVELARMGYDVTLVDFTPALLRIAERQVKRAGVEDRVKQILEGSITDLSDFGNNSFDAVLSLGGPVSHLLIKRDRQRAASELVRVAKKGAPVFISVMSRFGSMANELVNFQNEIGLPLFKRVSETGNYLGGYGFTPCHFFVSEDLRRLFEKKIRIVEMAALEGMASERPEEVSRLYRNRKRWNIWIKTHLKTCNHPSIIGVSDHMLLVGMKK